MPDTAAPRLRVLHRHADKFRPTELRLVAQAEQARVTAERSEGRGTSSMEVEPFYYVAGPYELVLDLAPLRGQRAVFALDEVDVGMCISPYPGSSSDGFTIIESIEVLP